jgi:hypothetical protein
LAFDNYLNRVKTDGAWIEGGATDFELSAFAELASCQIVIYNPRDKLWKKCFVSAEFREIVTNGPTLLIYGDGAHFEIFVADPRRK